MPNIAVGNTLLATIVGRLCGQVTMNTYVYRVKTTAAGVDSTDAGTAFAGQFLGASNMYLSFLGCTPANWQAEALWVQWVKPVRLRKQKFPAADNGTFGDSAQSANVQASISRYGEEAKRWEVGGIRVPIGTQSPSSANGFITPELKEVLQTHADEMTNDIVVAAPAVTWTPQVGQSKLASGPFLLKATEVQLTTRVIRRRTVGLGI